MSDGYTIGELSRRCGVHLETIRFYEREGLLPKPRRRGNGYRIYRSADVHRLSFIQRAKSLGFTLKEAAELLSLDVAGDSTCGDVGTVARKKLDEVRAKVRELKALEQALEALVKR